MGAGQPNRVTSVHLALRIAGDKAAGSALASDAFFPFPDNIEMAAAGGITAIAQPGGSIRDDECIEAANKLGVAMVLTGTRHFKTLSQPLRYDDTHTGRSNPRPE